MRPDHLELTVGFRGMGGEWVRGKGRGKKEGKEKGEGREAKAPATTTGHPLPSAASNDMRQKYNLRD